mgnify:CR=1 FL=1
MSTLLEKAQEFPPRGRRSRVAPLDEEVDLLIALIKGQVTYQQAASALGCSRQNIYVTLGSKLIQAIRSGKLQLTKGDYVNT